MVLVRCVWNATCNPLPEAYRSISLETEKAMPPGSRRDWNQETQPSFLRDYLVLYHFCPSAQLCLPLSFPFLFFLPHLIIFPSSIFSRPNPAMPLLILRTRSHRDLIYTFCVSPLNSQGKESKLLTLFAGLTLTESGKFLCLINKRAGDM